MTEIYLLIFIISCLVLIRAGGWVVRSLTRIAQFLGWREFIVASILMAFTTSLPEIFIGITSALHQEPELSVGNVIGSNVILLTLVIGIAAIFANGLKLEGKTLQRSTVYAAFIAFLPLILIIDGGLSRLDGLVLLIGLVFYFYRLFIQEEKFTKKFSEHFKRDWVSLKTFVKDIAIFLVAVFILLLSSEGIVYSATRLADAFDLPLVILGLFLVAFGTSIPEIVFGVRSVIMGHNEMIIGNTLGSVVVNSSLALGLVALISPFKIFNPSVYLVGIVFSVIAVVFFLIFSRTNQTINKKEALFLIEIYILFIVFEFLTKQW
jgi:cation:H+ antiporter